MGICSQEKIISPVIIINTDFGSYAPKIKCNLVACSCNLLVELRCGYKIYNYDFIAFTLFNISYFIVIFYLLEKID